jgi:hypothetical protein
VRPESIVFSVPQLEVPEVTLGLLARKSRGQLSASRDDFALRSFPAACESEIS